MTRSTELDWKRGREEVVMQDCQLVLWIKQYGRQSSEYAKNRVETLAEIRQWIAELLLL